MGQARSEPKTNDEIINYFLDTEAKEMHYEIARCRPLLSPDFFSHLQTKICEAFSTLCCLGPPACLPVSSTRCLLHMLKIKLLTVVSCL